MSTESAQSDTEPDPQDPEDEDESCSLAAKSKGKRVRKSQNQSSQVLKFLEGYVTQSQKQEEKRAEAAKKQHNEKMDIFKGLLEVLAKQK